MIQNSFWINDKLLYPSAEPLYKLHLNKVGKSIYSIELECFESGHLLIHMVSVLFILVG